MTLVNLVLTSRLASEHGVSMYLRKIKNLGGKQTQMKLTQGGLIIDTQPLRFSQNGFTGYWQARS